MVQQALDAVCERVAGCETVAFSDLSTQMVLVTNSTARQSRDALNLLCKQAHSVLQTGHQALVGTEDNFYVFARSASDPTEALCCICALDTDIAQVFAELEACFDTLDATAGSS
ncbi:MAG: hypothetical protein ABJL99_14710 [Aliishimia sp.]